MSLRGLHLRSEHAPGGVADTISNMPFSEDAIGASVTAMIGCGGGFREFEEGYREWRTGFDEGKGGFFAVTVAEAVEFIEGVLRP